MATSPERLTDLHRRQGWLTSWGIEAHVLSPEECVALSPLLDASVLFGGYHVPTDGLAKSVRVIEVVGRRAMERGARFVDRTTVTGIRHDDGRVLGLSTTAGDIDADVVVSCAGIWSPVIGAMIAMPTPLLPLAHVYVKTGPVPALAAIAASEADEDLRPILRHQDHDLYFREVVDRMGIGTYRHEPLPVDAASLLPPEQAPVMPSVLPYTPEHFAASWLESQRLIPALRETEVVEGIDGVFSFTPDGYPLMGESRDVRGFWVAEAVWVTHSAGVARAMAEWLVEGAPRIDCHEGDVNRFEPHQTTPAYIEARGRQNYIEVYDVIHPLQPMEDPRPLRVSPFHQREVALGACFLEGSGWERPQWFQANEGLLERYGAGVPARDAWSARYWSPIAGAEALATRDGVALYDMTSLKRLEVTGRGALAFLDGLTTNALDRPVGTVVYTLMLDERGGILSDLTIARLGRDRFQVGANGNLDLDRLSRLAPPDGSVHVQDITAGTCCIGLWGPRARDVLAPLTRADVSNEAFRYFGARELAIGHVPVTALRLSYVGELGWELYTTADLGAKLWDTLWEAGEAHGMIAAGRSAFGSLRLEKGYRSWGGDMTPEHRPDEAGLAFAVRMAKGEFVGRQALADAPPAERRLACLTLDDPSTVLMGKEPVLVDGRPAGYVTSAAFGFSVGRSIAYAWLPASAAVEGREVTVRSFDRELAATVAPDPLFDPGMTRLRA